MTTVIRDGRAHRVVCAECGSAADYPAYRCGSCEAPLVVEMDAVSRDSVQPDETCPGVWRYWRALPRVKSRITMGEGNTPMVTIDSPLSGPDRRVLAKLESLNPTLSFKDRGMALVASAASDLGLRGLTLASTGNAAVSAAAYAARAGLECAIVAATGSQANLKLRIAESHGASVRVVEGDYSKAYQEAVLSEGEGWLNVTTTYRNPLLAEAYRTVAYEIWRDLGHAPDVVVVPIGAGPLLRGIGQGFRDLHEVGLVSALPRLIGVQADACAPLARAWGSPDWITSLQHPIEARPSAAGAITDALRGYEREGLLTLAAVRDSDGHVASVSEAQMAHAARALASSGLLVEPAAAAALAALDDPRVRSMTEGATVVLVMTGHGVKDSIPSQKVERDDE